MIYILFYKDLSNLNILPYISIWICEKADIFSCLNVSTKEGNIGFRSSSTHNSFCIFIINLRVLSI